MSLHKVFSKFLLETLQNAFACLKSQVLFEFFKSESSRERGGNGIALVQANFLINLN